MKDSIQDILKAFPPQVVRLLARTGKGSSTRRLTHKEVALRSGLSYRRVRDLSGFESWGSVTIADADAFMRGCGVTLRNLWRHRSYLRRSLDPRQCAKPLAFATRRGLAQRPPSPIALVEAALSGRRA